MDIAFIVAFCAVFHLICGLEMKHGSCSTSCQNGTGPTEHDNGGTGSLKRFKCSCTSSCLSYGDCCYDSQFRSEDKDTVKPYTICLPVSKRRLYRAVAECPKDWIDSAHLCNSSIGKLPPVTSETTGTTYANIHCAICHRDEAHLKTWDVELRCCDEHGYSQTTGERHYTYNRGLLWSNLPDGSRCFCRYHAHNDDYSYLDGLEIRKCYRRKKIAMCSSTWTEDLEHDLCKSFLDPVYVMNKLYKNRYCAQCNYQNPMNGRCAWKSKGNKRGKRVPAETPLYIPPNFYKHTHIHKKNTRGRKYSYSDLLGRKAQSREKTISRKPRIRCRKGPIYDKRTKRCHKIKRKV